MTIVSAIGGIVLGTVLGWALANVRQSKGAGELAGLRAELSGAQQRVNDARDQLERERADHATALAGLNSMFEATSSRVLNETVTTFSEGQERLSRERDEKLRDNLKPLSDMLGEYQRRLVDFDKTHRDALTDVQRRATDLLEAQQRTQDETQRLNQLLGRSDHRGRWGEIQLANVMEASGLKPHIDYVLQVSSVAESGRAQRPDCVINLPHGAHIVVDAKFPYDDFEKAMATDSPDERRALKADFAKKLRDHIRALTTKAYWDTMEFTPEFTVCFVPSDAALSAAYEADDELQDFTTRQRVLLTSPTSLLALLWTAAELLRQAGVARSAQEILTVAQELYKRIRAVAEPMAKLGKSLRDTNDAYNSAVASVESRLIPIARKVRDLGGAPGGNDLAALEAVSTAPRALDEERWGVDLSDPALAQSSQIIDLEPVGE